MLRGRRSFHNGILVAKIMGARFVFFNLWKTLGGFKKEVVVPIIADTRYLGTDGETGAFLAPELMNRTWGNAKAHAGLQTDDAARLHFRAYAVHFNEQWLIRWRVVRIHGGELHENISPCPATNVLHFIPM